MQVTQEKQKHLSENAVSEALDNNNNCETCDVLPGV